MDMPAPSPAILARKGAIVGRLRAMLPPGHVIDDPAETRVY